MNEDWGNGGDEGVGGGDLVEVVSGTRERVKLTSYPTAQLLKSSGHSSGSTAATDPPGDCHWEYLLQYSANTDKVTVLFF